MKDPLSITRRQLLGRSALGLGTAALASLCGAAPTLRPEDRAFGRAKRVVFLLQAGAPSQLELFDPKPLLRERHGEELPEHVRGAQRLTAMSAQQASLPMAGSIFEFARHGQSGAWVSELLPHTAQVVDKLCIVRSMWTEAINHDPAMTFLQTGSQIAGRPCVGSWVSYGLGSENADLPAFIVLVSAGQGGQPLYARLWSSGFLDARHQGVRFREGRDPVLYLTSPAGLGDASRARQVEAVKALDALQRERELDPGIEARIAQYELAHRMQTSVPEATSLADEPDSTFELYGEDARQPGTYAANCLLARRLLERGVRFVQLYHQGWDHHDALPNGIREQALETDRASAGLLVDLERRGLLDETLVVWGGEFGRTAYCQGGLGPRTYGRDHHPRCFTVWLAGAGVAAGTSYGRTDEYGYNLLAADGAPLEPTKDRLTPGAVHVHDLHATMLHLLGFDHEALSVPHLGRRFRLTDVHGHVVRELLA